MLLPAERCGGQRLLSVLVRLGCIELINAVVNDDSVNSSRNRSGSAVGSAHVYASQTYASARSCGAVLHQRQIGRCRRRRRARDAAGTSSPTTLRSARNASSIAGDRDLLRLAGAPLGDAEEEAEAGRVALGERRRSPRASSSRPRRTAPRRRAAPGAAARRAATELPRRRGVVEEILRPRDQLLVIDRRVEEAAVLVVAKRARI